jgi:UDP-N-acetylglucosamine 2-epimerase (non-hydrolysing)
VHKKIKILLAFGTRPEAIKMAPIALELAERRRDFTPVVCVTSQHRHMQDQALRVFHIKPDYDLDLMEPGQSLNQIVSSVLHRMPQVLEQERPDYVLVQGDTSTAFAVSLAAFHLQIPIGHVEAGLRTHRKYEPFPEEINRKMISVVADMHFAPTKYSKSNLIREGYDEDSIIVTGNTVIDALFWVLDHTEHQPIPELLDVSSEAPIILVTGHRRESFGKPFRDICIGLKSIAEKYPDHHIIYPVHLNPNVRKPVFSILENIENIHLTEPLEYASFAHLISRAKIIISDSGGIQEEAAALGKRVLVMRNVTERPEGVEAGVCKLVGTDPERIFSEAVLLLEGNNECRKVRNNVTVFGDGFAGRRIVDALLRRVRGCEDSQSTYEEDITQREKRMESQIKDEKPEMKNLLRAARPVSS